MVEICQLTSSLDVSTKSSTRVSWVTYNPVDVSATLLARFPEHLLLPTSKQPTCSFEPNPSESLHVRLSRSLSTGFKFPLSTVIWCPPSPPNLTFCDISPCDWYCSFPRLEVKRWEAGPTPFPILACRGSQFSSQMSSPMVTDSRHGIPVGISSWNYQKTNTIFYISPHKHILTLKGIFPGSQLRQKFKYTGTCTW